MASDISLVGSVIQEILNDHGYRVLRAGECGVSSVVIGHSFPGPIHLLVADLDHGGPGKGRDLAENLAFLRPHMQAVFFQAQSPTLWLVRSPDAFDEERVQFAPGTLLQWVTGILSEGSAARP
ncbi:MAG: hypothetical protein JWP91_1362 [Fibrobacteres bacterium]|nr:hypothetical protein [Fibrobacterota bacterium]